MSENKMSQDKFELEVFWCDLELLREMEGPDNAHNRTPERIAYYNLSPLVELSQLTKERATSERLRGILEKLKTLVIQRNFHAVHDDTHFQVVSAAEIVMAIDEALKGEGER